MYCDSNDDQHYHPHPPHPHPHHPHHPCPPQHPQQSHHPHHPSRSRTQSTTYQLSQRICYQQFNHRASKQMNAGITALQHPRCFCLQIGNPQLLFCRTGRVVACRWKTGGGGSFQEDMTTWQEIDRHLRLWKNTWLSSVGCRQSNAHRIWSFNLHQAAFGDLQDLPPWATEGYAVRQGTADIFLAPGLKGIDNSWILGESRTSQNISTLWSGNEDILTSRI